MGNLRREAFMLLHNTEPLDLVWAQPNEFTWGNMRKVSARNVELNQVLNGLENKVSSKILPQTAEFKQLCITLPKRDTNGSEWASKKLFFYFPEKHVQSVCGYKLKRTKWGYLSSVPDNHSSADHWWRRPAVPACRSQHEVGLKHVWGGKKSQAALSWNSARCDSV